MLTWITDNALTITVIAIMLIAVGVAVFSLLKDKKNKKGGCTGNCSTCCMNCSYTKKQ